jgi:hypothetical protein
MIWQTGLSCQTMSFLGNDGLTAGPKESAKHEIWNEVLLCIAFHMRMDNKALVTSMAINARMPKHLCTEYDYDYEPNNIKKFFKCVFAFANKLGGQYAAHNLKDGKYMMCTN